VAAVILAGDVGGTKTVVALYESENAGLRAVRESVYMAREHASLEEIVGIFLDEGPAASIEAACFGVAGPVIDGRVSTTNLPWEIDDASLARATGARRAKLLNDLEAMAYGMLGLDDEEFAVLSPGAEPPPTGNAVVIAAGTGLGQALLVWDGERHLPVATEGGHTGFAPRSEQEVELLRFLCAEFGSHVSYERILSGPGLHNLYRFLRASGDEPEPAWLAERIGAEDPSAVIGEVGVAGREAVCAASVELFASIYGAQAGNLALTALAVGGVFVGGGIAPKLLPVLQGGAFVRAFTDKGRFSALLEAIPVRVALTPRTPVLGAARYAAEL
jgi:glucokinase